MKNKKPIYNLLVPKFIRKKIDNYKIKQKIINYYNQLSINYINKEEELAIEYLKKNKLSVFPYEFQNKYCRKDIKVYKDPNLKLKYVLIDGKRLYFKRKSSVRGIKRNFNNLLIEQDESSPHRYLTEKFGLETNEVLVDIGAAEGNLALSVIEKVGKVYLFETDKNWIEALEATFAPWKEKVEIINKFVSNKNDNNHISLDNFLAINRPVNFVKIDAEGAESEILEGAKTLLSSNKSLKVAICCYHKPQDANQFEAFFKDLAYSVSFSQGYMIFNEPKTFFPPYLRRGLLRAEK